MTTGENKGTADAEPRVGLEVREGYLGSRGLPDFSYVSWGHLYPVLRVLDGRVLDTTGQRNDGNFKAAVHVPLGFCGFLRGGCKGARSADVPGKGLGATRGKRL